MKGPLLVAILAAGFFAPALAQEDAASIDADAFVAEASAATLLEVESSALALERAESDDVRSFAHRVVADGNIADEKLKALAGTGLDAAATVDPEHYRKLETLSAAEDDGFDNAYLEMQIEAHEEALALFSSYAEGGEDDRLKSFAAEAVPQLEERLDDIRAMDRGG